MQDQSTPRSGMFDPFAAADDTVAEVVHRADDGWTAEQVEAEMVGAGFAPQQAADVIDDVWGKV